MQQPWGVIFDFDGVLVDSGSTHQLCWEEIARKRNKFFSRDLFLKGVGMKTELFVQNLLQWSQDRDEIKLFCSEKEALFLHKIKTEEIALLPGVRSFVEELQKQGISFGIGSSSPYKNIEIILSKHKILSAFSHIISGEDVAHGKPDPEVFQKAAQKIHLPPDQCVVIEDGYLGIEAAKRARCKAIALTTTFPEKKFFNTSYTPDVVVKNLKELSFAQVTSLFSL
jgi:beta-phosphoglucomutase